MNRLRADRQGVVAGRAQRDVDVSSLGPSLCAMTAGATVLSVDNVRLAFGGLRALDGASFGIGAGRLIALIGPNGAGKTTLFNVISGLLRADAGSIRLEADAGESHELSGLTPDRISRLGLVRTFQIARGLPKMTVFEHLMLYGPDQPGESLVALFSKARAVRDHEAALAEKALSVTRRLRLVSVIDNPVTALSGGQKKLLEIGRALMAEPRVILFDEPAAGVNPTLAEEIGDQLRAIVAEGCTVVLIEHDMALVSRVADDVIVLALGRKLAEGSFDEVRENADVQRAYLGVRAEIAA
jgi:ABC-type branched-subunit amino acid transport system ATPase component